MTDPAHGALGPGEHLVTALCETKSEAISDRALKLCIVSAIGACVEIDLTDCATVKKPVKLDVDAWFSTIVLKTKPSWTIALVHKGYAALGLTVAERPIYATESGAPPDLAVQGLNLFSKIIYR